MENIIWQQDSNAPNNLENLATIGKWWSALNGKEIVFAQRLIPPSQELDEINWETQKFDEKFSLQMPQIRGITVYWHKSDSKQEYNITPYKLELDNSNRQLYIYPQSQKQVVIRVESREIFYQTIELKDPQIAGTFIGKNYVILLRDRQQHLEVKLILSSQGLDQLRESLPE